MPERIRGDRKSQTRGKLSLFWVKCGGGSGGSSRGAGRGKPFPEEQPSRSSLYEASGDPQRFNSDAEGRNPRDDQELVPQNLQGLSQNGLRGRVTSGSPRWRGAVPVALGPAAAAISHCCTDEKKTHPRHSRHHLCFGASSRGRQSRAGHTDPPAVPPGEGRRRVPTVRALC